MEDGVDEESAGEVGKQGGQVRWVTEKGADEATCFSVLTLVSWFPSG